MKRIAGSCLSVALLYGEKAVTWLAIVAGLHQDLPPLTKSVLTMPGTWTFELIRLVLLVTILASIWLVPWDRLKSYLSRPETQSHGMALSRKGRLFDLDVAIRASGDTPDRIAEWPDIRHWLRKKFGDGLTDEELWERFRGWITAEKGMNPNTWLAMPYHEALGLLKKSARR